MKKKEKKQKVKKERKHISNMDKFMLVFGATLIAYLAIILPIRFCVVPFSWHWFVFGLIAIIIPFAFIYFQLWMQKKWNITDEQKKNASVVTVKYILYFWFLDCLYMTIFNQWKIWIYILGIIAVIKVLYSLTITFLGKKQKNVILDISLLLDFLLGVGLTVYLIYKITDAQLQNIVTAIVAAIYGGFITLVGVAWTIRKGDKDRDDDLKRRDAEKAEEARKQFVPYIKMAHGDPVHGVVDASAHCTLQLSNLSKPCFYSFTIKDFCIKNISNSNIILLGIFINDSYFGFSNDTLVEKDTACGIQTTRNWEYASKKPLEKLTMIIADVLDNRYAVECSLTNKMDSSILKVPADDGKEYTGFRSVYVVSSVSLPKLISKEKK